MLWANSIGINCATHLKSVTYEATLELDRFVQLLCVYLHKSGGKLHMEACERRISAAAVCAGGLILEDDIMPALLPPSQIGLTGRFIFSSTESRRDLSCWVILTLLCVLQIPAHSTGRAGKIAGSEVRKLNPAGVNFLVLEKKVSHANINISHHLLVFMSLQTRFHGTQPIVLFLETEAFTQKHQNKSPCDSCCFPTHFNF